MDPPLLICQVGATRLTYLARAIGDLHAMLVEDGDWVPLGVADEQNDAAPRTVEAGTAPRTSDRRLVWPDEGATSSPGSKPSDYADLNGTEPAPGKGTTTRIGIIRTSA